MTFASTCPKWHLFWATCLAGADAHAQGPASLALSLAWYALARTGTDASNGQGGRAGGRTYAQEVAEGRTRTWTLKLPTACGPAVTNVIAAQSWNPKLTETQKQRQ